MTTGQVRKKQAGFTLLEVLVAMVILAIGLLGLTALQIVAVKGNTYSNEMTHAAMLARQKFEQFRLMSYSDPQLLPSNNPHTEDVTDSRGQRYTLTWNVQDHTSLVMRTVALDVMWSNLRLGRTGDPTTVTVRFSTCIGQ